MTAVVGILNKQAIALAADSAVTVSAANGNKIFNRANKVFTLSKYHPVGIMLYNSASFMATPWEIIIKVYRKQLSDKSFPKIEDYKDDFLRFLKSKDYFADKNTQELFVEIFIKHAIDMLINESIGDRRDLLANRNEENKEKIINLIETNADKFIIILGKEKSCVGFEDLEFDEFNEFAKEILDRSIKQSFTDNSLSLTESQILKIKTFLLHALKFREKLTNYTGLIFVGYGDDEIYPKLLPINVSFLFKDRLRYFIDEESLGEISNYNNAAICPFAQTDVMSTILTGVDPSLDNTYLTNFKEAFDKYNKELIKISDEENAEAIKAQIQAFNIDSIIEEYANKIGEARRKNYIEPLLNAVGNLSKEDLAEMAESLIYLTYLKRRITFAEESVGGPVDVAVISKGDGFIWIKRKHYFKSELNQHFFNNYFNS